MASAGDLRKCTEFKTPVLITLCCIVFQLHERREAELRAKREEEERKRRDEKRREEQKRREEEELYRRKQVSHVKITSNTLPFKSLGLVCFFFLIKKLMLLFTMDALKHLHCYRYIYIYIYIYRIINIGNKKLIRKNVS